MVQICGIKIRRVLLLLLFLSMQKDTFKKEVMWGQLGVFVCAWLLGKAARWHEAQAP